jgi:hypothetical protein
MRRISWLPWELLDAMKDSAPWIERMSVVRECVSLISNAHLVLTHYYHVPHQSKWVFDFFHRWVRNLHNSVLITSVLSLPTSVTSLFKTPTLRLLTLIAGCLVSAFVLSCSDVHTRFCWEKKNFEDLGVDRSKVKERSPSNTSRTPRRGVEV